MQTRSGLRAAPHANAGSRRCDLLLRITHENVADWINDIDLRKLKDFALSMFEGEAAPEDIRGRLATGKFGYVLEPHRLVKVWFVTASGSEVATFRRKL